VLVVGASVVVVVEDVLLDEVVDVVVDEVVELVVGEVDVVGVVVVVEPFETSVASGEDDDGTTAASSATTSDASSPAPAHAVATTDRQARSATTDARVECCTKRT